MAACQHEHLSILGFAGGASVTHEDGAEENDELPCSIVLSGR